MKSPRTIMTNIDLAIAHSPMVLVSTQHSAQIAESILPQVGFRCYKVKIEESEKGPQPPGVESRTPLA